MKKILKIGLCALLILTCCFSFTACGKKNKDNTVQNPFGDDYYNTIGNGRQGVYFYFVDAIGNRQNFLIATDAVYLLEAFRENNMVTSPVGEEIKNFAGNTADETNGYRWVLYADGKKVEGNYEDVKINVKVTYSMIAERIDLM